MTDEPITLREFIEQRIDIHEAAHKCVHALEAEALQLQGREYERRLTDLNHAHAEAQRVLGTYITRNEYQIGVKDYDTWKNGIDKTLANMAGRSAAYGLAFGTVITLVNIGISLFFSLR